MLHFVLGLEAQSILAEEKKSSIFISNVMQMRTKSSRGPLRGLVSGTLTKFSSGVLN